MRPDPCRLALLWAWAALGLGGCAAPFGNAPQNPPITPEFLARSAVARDTAGENVIAMSLSGGGMRAAAFAFGALEALANGADGADGADGTDGADVFDDLTFISSVSGGSLTAAYFGLHGRDAFNQFRSQVLERDLERDMRMSLLSPANLLRLFSGGRRLAELGYSTVGRPACSRSTGASPLRLAGLH